MANNEKWERDSKNGKRSVALGVAASEDEVAETDALLFHASEQTPSPDEFGSEKPQTEQHHEPARSRAEKQHRAENQKREAEKDAKEAFGLLKSPEKHFCDLFRSTNQLRGPWERPYNGPIKSRATVRVFPHPVGCLRTAIDSEARE